MLLCAINQATNINYETSVIICNTVTITVKSTASVNNSHRDHILTNSTSNII